MDLNLSTLLVRFLLGALALFIGDRILTLVKNPQAKEVLDVILIVAVVLFIAFGSIILK